MAETLTPDLEHFIKILSDGQVPASLTPMVQNNLDKVVEDVTPEERVASLLAAVAYNINPANERFDKQNTLELVRAIDLLVADQLNTILHAKDFQHFESTWRSIHDLVENTNFLAGIDVNLLDMSKEEAFEDLELNLADIAGSELFKKIYVKEYDTFGGAPFGAMIGLYEFSYVPSDLTWLRGIIKVAASSHAPFVAAASPKFFGCDTMAEVNQLRDIGGMFSSPTYTEWNKVRELLEAGYVGLTLPRYMVRPPYHEVTYPAEGIDFNEDVTGRHHDEYLWGNSAMLFARNLTRSFETSGWCQHIRGVKAGGLLSGLACHIYNIRGENELKAPVEISMPDFREFELANAGFIPLIHKKNSADAVFFSVQSIKKSYKFKDPKDSENSQLVTNLSYTYSISRIAHYLKCIMRDNIGSTADGAYITGQINAWISRYVTTLVNPDDLTLRYFPFKAYSVEVNPVPGKIGWYHCNLAILPHIQFEGMDVDLRVDARLGSA